MLLRQIKTRRSPAVLITSATPVAAATSVAASPAIASASAGIDRIARTIQCGITATEPVGNAPAVSAAVVATARSGAVAR